MTQTSTNATDWHLKVKGTEYDIGQMKTIASQLACRVQINES